MRFAGSSEGSQRREWKAIGEERYLRCSRARYLGLGLGDSVERLLPGTRDLLGRLLDRELGAEQRGALVAFVLLPRLLLDL